MRRHLPAAGHSPEEIYSLLTTSVVPRPIAWVSTRAADGVPNLAPYSFFTIASQEPPIVSITSVGEKDTLRNIRETGEFCVNIVPEELIDEVNASSAPFGRHVDEFAAVGATPEPAEIIEAPRVAESPVSIECTLHALVPVGNGVLVLGEVVAFDIDESVLGEDGFPLVDRLRPASRLGRNEWGLAPRTTERERPTAP